MAAEDWLKSRLKELEEAGVFGKDEDERILAEDYLDKARHNLIVMSNGLKISTIERIKSDLKLAKNFNQFDWAVIQGYYAMYMASLACLAKIGLKSRNHSATSFALELFFVQKGLLEKKYLDMLNKIGGVSLEKRFVDIIIRTRKRRMTAQYNAGSFIQKQEAEGVEKDAKKFIDRLDKLFNEIAEDDNAEDEEKDEEKEKQE